MASLLENITSTDPLPTEGVIVPKKIFLPFWTCFFVNSPENGSFPTLDSNSFYWCKLKIKYLVETECNVFNTRLACGYWICVAITAVIVLFANFGMFSNILNLIILPKSLKGCSVKRLMVLLATFDLIASICAIPVSLLLLFILGRYENRFEALEAFRILYLFFSLGRTGSIFITILITIERYIAVAFPLKQWLKPRKVPIHLTIVIIFIIGVNLPWWLNKRLEPNETFLKTVNEASNSSFSDLSEFPYIFKGTAFARNIYPKFVMVHLFVDFALPFPLLLIFNGLLYRSIYQSNKIRQTLTISQRREINAARMFCIVAFILLLCHTVAVVIFIQTQVHRQTFRELQFCQVLSMTLNASINFMIYYLFGKSFRNEFWSFLHKCKLFTKVAVTPSTSTNGTIEMGTAGGNARSIKLHQRGGAGARDNVHA